MNQYNEEIEDDSDLSDKNHTMPTTHFPFGMNQTPFYVMSNWTLKYRNNKEDSPAYVLNDHKRFKKGHEISSRDISENLDALMIDDAKYWCLINKNYYRTLSDFFRVCQHIYIGLTTKSFGFFWRF